MPPLRPLTALWLLLLTPALAEPPALPALAAHLREYVHRRYPCRILSVTATADEIEIHAATAGASGDLALAEFSPLDNVIEAKELHNVWPIQQGEQLPVLRVKRHEGAVDRLFSRWALVRGAELLSAPHYADEVRAVRPPPAPREPLRTRKGVGAYSLANPQEDLTELGLSAVTVNVLLSSFVNATPGPGRSPFPYGDRTWYSDDHTVEGMDRTLLEAAKHHLAVSAIILVPLPPTDAADTTSFRRLVAHPGNNGGIFAMPNLTSAEGLNAYAAAMDFLASRYTQADGAHGRIHDWIMFNEVDSAASWANAGPMPDWVYDDLLVKGLRVAYLIVRQYDPGANIFVSLDQHWTASPGAQCYPGRTVLEQICDLCAAEGDFPWAVAHHPYPQDLNEPRVWQDTQATFSFNTPKITFKNLEVLTAYLDQPRLRYLGKERRRLQLTEQGLNSRNYSPDQLQLQAAGMAFAWNKIKRLPGIELFDYHNWIDNRGEGGLRIGLRRFRDDETEPLGRKPIWYVYQALGTPRRSCGHGICEALDRDQRLGRDHALRRDPVRASPAWHRNSVCPTPARPSLPPA